MAHGRSASVPGGTLGRIDSCGCGLLGLEELEVEERRRSYPGTLRQLRQEDLGRVPEGSNYSRDRPQTVQSSHANPLAGVENLRMTLQNRRR